MNHPANTTAPSAPSGDGSPDLLKVSAYDRVSSMIVALLVMVGSIVAMLGVVWWTSQLLTRPASQEVFLVEEEGEETNEQDAREVQEPGLEDLALVEPDVQETLAAVTDAVSSISASLDAIETAVSTRGQGGEGRKAGSGVIPRWQRWEVRFLSTTLESYAKQLEFFGIELAAMGGGKAGVDYAAFDKGRIVRRQSSEGDEDKRLYFVWQGGRFQQQDRTLLAQAGINTQGRITCQFFPPQLENTLAVLEQKQLGGKPLKQVKRTVFAVRPQGSGFEFYVVEIQSRSG